MLLLAVFAVYVWVAGFVFGFFLGDELRMANPEYGMVVLFAVGWPVALLYGLGVRLFVDEEGH